jgi:thiol-disulfide isomerase/thioredoxin
MKKILLSLTVLASVAANAQLAPYSMAPDFTATDIEGVEHNLQTYLDEGKTVIMDVSATWCGPCWAFHEAGVLDDVHNTYGPDGTNQVVVLFIEGDPDTGAADLTGDTQDSQGDWTNSDYPIIDDASISDDYEVGYFPTIYAICPSGFVIEIGQADPATGDYWTAEAMYEEAISICPLAETNIDASVWSTNFPVSQPCGIGTPGIISPEVFFINNGFDALTNLTFTTFVNGNEANIDNVTGNYDSYETDWITLSDVEVNAGDEVTVTVTASGDMDDTNNEQIVPFNFMAIGGVVGTTPLVNDLSNEDLTADGWAFVDADNNGAGWIGWYGQGENGQDGSIFYLFYNAPNGQVDRFISPAMDFSGMTNVYCNFAYTKANYANGAGNDKLEIQVSTNCGATWSTVWSKAGAALDTEPAVNPSWAPTGSEDWASASADLTQWAGQDEVLVSFTGTSGYGNNLFVDNINISNIANNVAEQVESFSTGVYPNPTNNNVTINADRNTTVTIFDATGKLVETTFMNNPVQTISLQQYGTGLYMIQLSHEGKTATHRVMVQE